MEPLDAVVSLEIVAADERRSITEASFSSAPWVRVSQIDVRTPSVLGNHWHRRLTELFILTSGEALLARAPINADERIGDVAEERIHAGAFVRITPGVAHAFRFEGPGTLLCLSDRAFEADDLIPAKLV